MNVLVCVCYSFSKLCLEVSPPIPTEEIRLEWFLEGALLDVKLLVLYQEVHEIAVVHHLLLLNWHDHLHLLLEFL